MSETVDGTTKSYVLDKNRPYAQVLAEYEEGTEVANYTYGLDLIEQERGGNESYYSVDGLGSTRGLTDESGNVTDTYTYDAYGNVVGSSGGTENSYLFAGEQFDGTLGQYYLRQRYYDPNSGRFTRRDTYEGRNNEPITLHKYLYAHANPVNGIDPSGLFTLADITAARKVRNTLAEVQFDSYLDLIRNTDANGLGGAISGFIDLIQGAISFANIFQALPAAFGMILSSKQSKSIAKIVKQFKNFECDSCAKKLKSFMKKNKIPGKHIRISTGSSRGLDQNIWDDSLQKNISETGIHEGILIKVNGVEMVLDNHRPFPIPKEEWLNNMVFHSKAIGVKSGFDEFIIEEF